MTTRRLRGKQPPTPRASAEAGAACRVLSQDTLSERYQLELFSGRLNLMDVDARASQESRLNYNEQMARAKTCADCKYNFRFGLPVRAQRCHGAKYRRSSQGGVVILAREDVTAC